MLLPVQSEFCYRPGNWLAAFSYFCRMNYPVLEIVEDLKQKFAALNIAILQAPPGAGKSTILPLQLINESWLAGKKIIMLEPRRLAARSVAMRMANLLDEEVGKTIGYRVRFETKVSAQTKIEVVTEGILTRMIQSDNSLDGVGLLIFDEFHERSLQADLALALSLQVQQILRSDLRLLIMSATLDTSLLSDLLKAPVITSMGRQHPVAIKYYPPDPKAHVSVNVTKAIRKTLHEEKGDILVFLPGAGEIHRCAQLLEEQNPGATIHTLYGDLPFKKQQQAILPDPNGHRKIVLSTSIAETSLTIEGISVVIDCGLARVPRFDPRSGLTRLETVRVAKDSADQRAGRAGRLGPGVAYRLWNEREQSNLVANRKPEILEADLSPLMLELANWGVTSISELTWITPPPPGAVNQAIELLRELGALENNKITERGIRMAKLPTHPRLAHMFIESLDIGQNYPALAADIASLLEERDPLPRESGADLSLRVEVLRKWRKAQRVDADTNVLERIERVASSWRKLLKVDESNDVISDTDIGKLLMEAYPERIAHQIEKHGERYKLFNGRVAKLPPHDPLTRISWLAIAELDAGVGGEGKIFQAAPIDQTDLLSHAKEVENVFWDVERKMVAGTLDKRIGNLVLSSKTISKLSSESRLKCLFAQICAGGLRMIGWSDNEMEWQARVLSLKKWRPNENWPDVTDAALLLTLEDWFAPFTGEIYKQSELQKLNLNEITQAILPWELSTKLDRLAPVKIEVPSGSSIKLRYSHEGSPPVMEVRLQEVFGLADTPTVNEGRQKIMMHLLSPGYKPVQVTQDLKSFWNTTYHDVRKELRMRYPKHSWPDDPWTAVAVRGAKRRY
jgi:ATP-dependent helicase HrpB